MALSVLKIVAKFVF